MILYQNLTSDHFLNVSFNVESKTLLVNFLNPFYIRIHWLFLHFEWISAHASFYCIMYFGILVRWVIQIFHMVTHFIIQFEEVPVVIITTDLIRKIFTYWNVVKLTVKTFSKILIFNWKLEACPWQQQLSVVFPELTFSLHCRENVCQIPKSK